MSFGFSLGDFIAFVDAPSQFRDISDEFRSLSIILQDVEVLLERELNNEQKKELQEISNGCRNVLEKLEHILDKYGEL
ncbi:hypothetical protein VE01_06350 [Pseudogymnoascus verrucosus]|uniref:Uncharacterized protein n=1 Tax=Pseudogymnoascus verrucosus TaxID=342668 RepID=A0A1B8GGA0_9PEZI|nr:uncharacterized protein VE01_06350 [Pseudogymnoascus verrucosus]OBT94850.1 hypothetical protein VE01_06350 [Pseudogymnoascus verrucosus]